MKRIHKKILNLITSNRVPWTTQPIEFSDREFIENAYQIILNRKADEKGFSSYFEQISKGEMSRKDFVLSLVRSNEFERTHDIFPSHEFFIDYISVGSPEVFAQFVKNQPLKDIQLNELVNSHKWIDSEWRKFGKELQVVPMSLQSMHRKGFEWIQTIYGLSLLGKIRRDSIAMGVGTGHECIVYWLARYLKKVYATDLFAGEWQSKGSMEGDPGVLKYPEKYQPFDYPKDRLRFLPMDGRHLAFKDNSFDIVFSLSSIEHFGGKEAAALAMKEMGRVLKPGGTAVVSTEYILNNAEHPEYFNEKDLRDHVVEPSRMKLIQNINFNIPRILIERPLEIPSEVHKTPHMSLTHGNVIFTSIILFFEKTYNSM